MKEYSYGVIPYLFTNEGIYIMLSKSSKKSDYGFVKGKTDLGETAKETAVREVFEEIGVTISVDDLEDLVIQKNPRKDVGLYFINWEKYKDFEIKLDPRELYSTEWFKINNVPEVSKNQRLIITDVFIKFNKLNFHNRKINDS